VRKTTIFLALGLCAAAAPPDRVTIVQAVQEAVDRNLGLLAERFNVSVAEARVITARLRPNPVLSLALDYQDMLGTGFSTENGAGPPEAGVRVDYLLERGRKRQYRIEVAQNARAVAEFQLLNTTRSLVMDVQSAFVDVLQAKESLALARENLKAFESIVEINEARVRAGDLSKVELVRSRVAALQFRNAVRQAESRVRLTANRLQTLMGRVSLSPSFDVEGALRREPLLDTEDVLQTRAVEARPDLTALRRDEARSLADVRLQLAERKIDYTVGVQYHRQYDTAHGNSLGFFFSAPLPVFNRNQGEIARAQREQEQLRSRLRAAEAQVRAEVRDAFVGYTTARDLLETFEKSMLAEARDVRDTTEYSYRRGEASFVELLDAQRAFNDTVQGYHEARAEFARSLYQIDSATGKGVTP
jgi:outer membrane protein, heavy metal efflux system